MPKLNVNLQRELYSIEAVQKAFYKFKRHDASEITIIDSETIRVTFNFPINITDQDKEKVLTDFRHEVVDCSLREKISSETEFARNLILANAFSNAPIGDDIE